MIKRTTRKFFSVENLEARTLLSATPTAADRRFVDAIVGTAQGDAVSAAAKERLAADLTRGVGRGRAVLAMLTSPGADAARVNQAFQTVLDRAPSAAGLRWGSAILNSGKDTRAIERRLAGSPEFYTRIAGGTPAGFVRAIDAIFLARNPGPAEAARAATPAGRLRLLNSVIDGAEYRSALATSILSEAGEVDAKSKAHGMKVLAMAGGVERLRAQVLASAPIYARLSAEPLVETPTTTLPTAPADLIRLIRTLREPRSATLGAVAAPPVTSVTNSLTPTLVSGYTYLSPSGATSRLFQKEFTVAASGSDGSFVVGGESGLLIYHPTNQFWSAIGDGQPVVSLSVAAYNDLWAIEQPSGGSPTLVHYRDGASVEFFPLPTGIVPAQVSASSDGTVWVLDTNGDINSLSPPILVWNKQSTPAGLPVTAIAFGTDSNAQTPEGSRWVLAGPSGTTQLYRLTKSDGWIPDPTFAPGTITSLFATADGSAWVVANGQVFVHPYLNGWYQINATTLPTTPTLIAPYSALGTHAVYPTVTDAWGNSVPVFINGTVGLADQTPNTAFPAWTVAQQSIYEYISHEIVESDNIRAVYNNLNVAPSSLVNDIKGLKIPNGPGGKPLYTQDDWDAVVAELIIELDAVGDVDALFSNINGLISDFASVQSTLLPSIQSLIHEESPPPSDSSTVRVFFEGLVESIIAAVGAAFPEEAILSALVYGAVATSASTYEASLNGGAGGGDGTALAYSEFSAAQATIFANALTLAGTYQNTILLDYGRLMLADGLILDGTWKTNPITAGVQTGASIPYFKLYDYQSLFPVKWEIIEVTNFPKGTHDPIRENNLNPAAAVQTITGHSWGNPIYDVKYSNNLGNRYPLGVWVHENDYGPFPTSDLMNVIGTQLPIVSISDFWDRANGWENISYTLMPNNQYGN